MSDRVDRLKRLHKRGFYYGQGPSALTALF